VVNRGHEAVIAVKGGGTNSAHIRDLKGTMEREGAARGVFLTLNKSDTRNGKRRGRRWLL
jgi:hypothetical protein